MQKPWWEDGAFIAIVSVDALILTVLPAVIQPGRKLEIAVCLVFVSVLIAILIILRRRRIRPPHITPRIRLVDLSMRPGTADDLLWIANLQEEYFRGDAVPLETLQNWHSANPNTFHIVLDDKGNRIGYIDVLPFKEQAFVPFIAGTIRERDLTDVRLKLPQFGTPRNPRARLHARGSLG